MDEVNANYSCFICSIRGLTHEAWKDHQITDEHYEMVKNELRKQWFCKKCDYQFESKRLFDRHCESKKHRFGQLTLDELFCKKCNTQCHNESEWTKHIQTKKHLNTKEEKVKQMLFCEKCNTQCQNKAKWDDHILTKKHLNTKVEKTAEELCCNLCNTQCHNDSEWNKHIKTKKHITNTSTNGEGISITVQQCISEGTKSD